jgi:hypothetical protein
VMDFQATIQRRASRFIVKDAEVAGLEPAK